MSIILLDVNSVVGSGIFLFPGRTYAMMGLDILYVYGFLTVVVMRIAMCYAKVGSMFTRTGGSYVYAREAFSELTDFEVGLRRYIVGMIAWAAISVAFATALGAV